MAENTSNDKPSKSKVAPRKSYEVLGGPINLGRKDGQPDLRKKGQTLYHDELPEADIRALIAKREIADTDAPVPPSQAEGMAALDDLLDVAIAFGVVKRTGADYEIEGRVFHGISEVRDNVTRDYLKAALVKKAKA